MPERNQSVCPPPSPTWFSSSPSSVTLATFSSVPPSSYRSNSVFLVTVYPEGFQLEPLSSIRSLSEAIQVFHAMAYLVKTLHALKPEPMYMVECLRDVCSMPSIPFFPFVLGTCLTFRATILCFLAGLWPGPDTPSNVGGHQGFFRRPFLSSWFFCFVTHVVVIRYSIIVDKETYS